MSAEIGAGDPATGPFDTLHAEAKEALSYAANTLRAVTERYREAFHEDLAGWHGDRDVLDRGYRQSVADRGEHVPGGSGGDSSAFEPIDPAVAAVTTADTAAAAVEPPAADVSASDMAAAAARSDRLRRMNALRTSALGDRQAELGRLELAVRSLERVWLFLERGDASLLADPSRPDLDDDLQMRIVEAREAERTRLAQEVHDGPAQALANAVFGVEYIEKLLEGDRPAARVELRFLRERLRRELADVRAFISHLRPPLLDQIGLDGAIHEATETLSAVTGIVAELDLQAPPSVLDDTEQVVVLRVLQEALQNVRKHAGARVVRLATHLDGAHWSLEVRDDGRGFDPDIVTGTGRRTFGLQFMRERAALVRGRLEIRSQPAQGTVVVLDIPVGQRGGSA